MITSETIIGNKVFFGDAPPEETTFKIGDIFVKELPIAENQTAYIKTQMATGGGWSTIDDNKHRLIGQEFYGFGDSIPSITGNTTATVTFYDVLCQKLGMYRVKKIGATEISRSGATMQKRAPINKIGSPNMVDWSSVQYCPVYNENTKGLVWLNYLTNDVGLNLPNYTPQNYATDMGIVFDNLLNSGWSNGRIKVNLRHFITLLGLDYTTVANSGVTIPATLERYNDFAGYGVEKCNEYGIQSFDLYDIFKHYSTILSEFDGLQRHYKNNLQNVAGNYMFDKLEVW